MTVIKKGRLGKYTVSLYVGRQTKVTGINSALKGGLHIIMWEFDNPDPSNMLAQLTLCQQQFDLSPIHIARSSDGGGYHAYCFTAVPWIYSIHIVSGTGGVDPGYISMCAMRGHWTLRTTDKGQGTPKHWRTLPSEVEPDCDKHDLAGGTHYNVWERKSHKSYKTARCTACGFPAESENLSCSADSEAEPIHRKGTQLQTVLYCTSHNVRFSGESSFCPDCLYDWVTVEEPSQ